MFTLDGVVLWGRSFDEYRRMFDLSGDDLRRGRILGCADGPASFNAEATRQGARVVSCDPLYQYPAKVIAERIAVSSDLVLEQTRRNPHQFVWRDIHSIDHLAFVRQLAMQTFLDDYELGQAQGRYIAAELPSLPFDDKSFDLAVCSHFLFLYSDQLTEGFHNDAILELCRVAVEVRIFPLLTLAGQRSPFVEPASQWLQSLGYEVSISTVPYEFQRGGNQMLQIR